MMESDFACKIAALAAKEPRFDIEVYGFVSDAVTFSVARLSRERHVSAAELLDGIREFATVTYGVVASQVLASWGLTHESHVGEVVYLLINAGLLRASKEDSPEDFNTGRPLFPQVAQIRTVRRKSDKLPFID